MDKTKKIIEIMLASRVRPAMYFGDYQTFAAIIMFSTAFSHGAGFWEKDCPPEEKWLEIYEKVYKKVLDASGLDEMDVIMEPEKSKLSSEEQFIVFLDTLKEVVEKEYPEYLPKENIGKRRP